MGKKEQIRNFKKAKEVINIGSKTLRNHVDNVLLPSVEGSKRLTIYAKEIRREFMSGSKLAKAQANAAINYIENPQPEYPDAHPEMSADFLGAFNWFKIIGWKKKNQQQAEDYAAELIQESRLYGFGRLKSFLWLSDGLGCHSNLNYKTPWLWDGKDFHLDEPEERFWELFEIWVTLHKQIGQEDCTELFMRPSYCKLPFTKNVNGVGGFWSPEARPYQLALAQRVMDTYLKVRGRPPRKIKIGNEFDHGGNAQSFHDIMYFNEDIYKKVLMQYIPPKHLRKIIAGLTLCEGAGGELRERHTCAKPEACDRGGWHGTEGWPRSDTEKHGFSALPDFRELIDIGEGFMVERIVLYLGSANRYRNFTEDGGSQTKSGNYQPRPGYFLGDAKQQKEMVIYVGKAAIKEGKPGAITFGSFPHHALFKKNGLFVPNYRKSIVFDEINSGRYRAIQEGWEVVKG